MSRIISFRDLLADGARKTITLHTNNGKTGYRIKKLELFPAKFGYLDQKSTVTIFKTEDNVVSSAVDFSDNRLLAASCLSTDNSEANPLNLSTVFDGEVFNQDIEICHNDGHGDSNAVNYYMELEQMDLAMDEATVATLKNIRNTGT